MKNPDPCTKRIWAMKRRFTAGGNSRKYIVVHNTGNTATAVQEANNLKNNYAAASFHYVLDDTDIIQCVHDYDTAWAVGAWSGCVAYIRNSESISIEVCSNGTAFSQAERDNLRKLVMHLMEYYGIQADHVVRHYDCHSGRKACPAAYCGTSAKNAAWKELHAYITGAAPQSSGVPYVARVTVAANDHLNIRKGPGTDTAIVGEVHRGDAYTIVEEADGPGAAKWGRLKSGAGWISLDFTEKV